MMMMMMMMMVVMMGLVECSVMSVSDDQF